MSILFKAPSAPAPFRISISPHDVFVHPAWQRARETCLASLHEGACVLLCGAPGTGKSMLLHDLAETLRRRGRSVALLPYGAAAVEAADTEILLVDEADRLSGEQIRQLCLFSNPVVLAGLPELRDRVAECVGVVGSVTLHALSADDVARLVAARLKSSGRSSSVFTPDSLTELARHSGGLFRVVVILAGAALFFAELRGAEVVTATDIGEAAAMREAIAVETQDDAALAGPRSAPVADTTRWLRRVLAAVVAVLAVIGVAVHLAASAGGSAAATIEAGRTDLQPLAASVAAEPPPTPPLSPKRPLAKRV